MAQQGLLAGSPAMRYAQDLSGEELARLLEHESRIVLTDTNQRREAITNRLTANPTVSVLLLEYGGRDLNPMLYIPKGFYFTLNGDRYTYQYPTKPFKADGTGEAWTRGKVMGGSTSVNGMMYARGSKRHYDELVKRGNPGWGWDDMLPIFLQMEDHQLGASPMRGAGGPYGVSLPEVDDAAKLVLESARSIGMKVVAEGVEDAACLQLLSEMGCDTAQGYHISRPMSGDSLVDFLAERTRAAA